MTRKNKRRILIVVCAAIFLVSAGAAIWQGIGYHQGEKAREEAAELVDLPDMSDIPVPSVQPTLPPSDQGTGDTTQQPSLPGEEEKEEKPVYVDPYADALRSMDFAALREVNDDVLGWILIPGTAVSYPLVQGEDNSYYLNHTWKMWRSSVGSIFMECRNSADLSDYHTIIYGHRMINGSMFASLKNYKKQSYWEKHPCVYITDDNGTHKYDIFAAYEADVESATYCINFSDDTSRQAFIEHGLSLSVIQTGIVPDTDDAIITLSTCTGNGHDTRWVVQARKEITAPVEEEPVEDALAEAPLEDGEQTEEETLIGDGESGEDLLPADGDTGEETGELPDAGEQNG